MKIPKKIKFLGREIAVKRTSDKELEGATGSHFGKYAEIKIVDHVDEKHAERVFIEELVHAILYDIGQYDLANDEKLVQSFSTILHSILRDNKFDFSSKK